MVLWYFRDLRYAKLFHLKVVIELGDTQYAHSGPRDVTLFAYGPIRPEKSAQRKPDRGLFAF